MLKDIKGKVLASYLLRFTILNGETCIQLCDLRTGECLEFETWVSAWEFLDQRFESGSPTSEMFKKR